MSDVMRDLKQLILNEKLRRAKKKDKPKAEIAANGLISGIEKSLKDLSFKTDRDSIPVPTETYMKFLGEMKEVTNEG